MNKLRTESDGLLLGTGVIGDNVGPLEGEEDGVNVGLRVGGVLGDFDGCVKVRECVGYCRNTSESLDAHIYH